jgi:hypothetical protein
MRSAKSSIDGRNLIASLELFACISVMPSRNSPMPAGELAQPHGWEDPGNPYN